MIAKSGMTRRHIGHRNQSRHLRYSEETEIKENARACQACLTPEHRDILALIITKDATLVRLFKDNSGGLYIAGGFPVCSLIGVPIGDVDIFGKDQRLLMEAARIYSMYSAGQTIKSTKYTLTVDGKIGRVQFVLKETYQDSRDCIDSFDFTICQASIWFEKNEWRTVCSPKFYSDLKARRLRFINQERVNESPSSSLWRAAKYRERGFNLSRDDKVALLERFFQNYQRKNAEQCEHAASVTRKYPE